MVIFINKGIPPYHHTERRVNMWYCWDFFEMQEKPKWLPEFPMLKFVVDREFKLQTPDRLAPLEGSVFFLITGEPIIVKPGTYEVYEVDGGGLLFVGESKFPAVVDMDDLNALANAEVGAIRFI